MPQQRGGKARGALGTPSGELRVRTLVSCFLRCYLVGAAYNTRGLQHVGLAFAMEPGLIALYPDAAERDEVVARYLKLYNTHFFWTPLLVGLFISLGENFAQGPARAVMRDNVKSAT